jgi:hypothetical protein
MVVLSSPYIDFAPVTSTGVLTTSPVNITGGGSSCGGSGSAGLLYFQSQQWLTCFSGGVTPVVNYGLTTTVVDLVGAAPLPHPQCSHLRMRTCHPSRAASPVAAHAATVRC